MVERVAHSHQTAPHVVTNKPGHMKKRLIIGMVAASIASGFLMFGKPTENKTSEDSFQVCATDCCEDGPEECEPSCCKDTEMCCQ